MLGSFRNRNRFKHLDRVAEGIVAKRKRDPYGRGARWWKIKNAAYSQADDGRGELLNGRAIPSMMRDARSPAA